MYCTIQLQLLQIPYAVLALLSAHSTVDVLFRMTCSPCCYVCAFLCAGVCCVLQRCVAAAKATFKAIAVSEPRIRGAAKAALRDALQQRFDLVREAVLARAAAKVDQQLLKAAQQISTVRQDPAWFLTQVYPPVCCSPAL